MIASPNMSFIGEPPLRSIPTKPNVKAMPKTTMKTQGMGYSSLNSGRQSGIMPRMPPRTVSDMILKSLAILVKL